MRITNSMMVNQFLTESNDALNRVSKYQSQVDSTKRISSISDDPQATTMALQARSKLSNLALYQSNISTASSYLTEAESAASALNELVKSAYDDIISAQSGAKTPEDLAILAESMKNLQNEVLSISNSSIGSSYLFGGYNYTGTTDGITKTPPFSLDVNGSLIYNGINLSQYALKDEIENYVGNSTPANPGLMSGYSATVTSMATYFAGPPAPDSGDYAKSQAAKAADALNNLVKSGKATLAAAAEFDINNTNQAGYKALSAFIYGDSTKQGIEAVSNALHQAIASDTFDSTTVNKILNVGDLGNPAPTPPILPTPSASTLLGTGLGSMSDAIMQFNLMPGLSGSPTPLSDTVIETEAAKKTKIQIGPTQTVDLTMTGLDLLGTGENNLYHILGKCVKMLNGEMSSDGLSSMISTLQDAQSAVLTLETRIGATQNRLTMTGSRYDNSKLNYTEMKSNAMDVDMAEAIMNLTTAQTVYSAALAGGAEIIKTSLIDFLR